MKSLLGPTECGDWHLQVCQRFQESQNVLAKLIEIMHFKVRARTLIRAVKNLVASMHAACYLANAPATARKVSFWKDTCS